MAYGPTKSPCVLLAFGLWLLVYSPSWAYDDYSKTLNLRVEIDDLLLEGKFQEAIPIAERVVEVAKRARGPEHRETADALNQLGLLYYSIRDYAKAEPLYQEALRIRQKVLGRENPDTARSLSDLAELYEDTADYAKAEPLFQEVLRIRQKVIGPDSPDTVSSLNDLAVLYKEMGEYVKAEPLYQEMLRIALKVPGRKDEIADCLIRLADLYSAMSDYAKAEPLYQEALGTYREAFGSESDGTAICLHKLAGFYERAIGDYAKAELLYQEALGIEEKLAPESGGTANALNDLGGMYADEGEYAKAEALFQKALRIKQKVYRPEDPRTTVTIMNLGWVYMKMGEYAKAEPLLHEALRIWQKLRPEHFETMESLNDLAELYRALGEYNKAKPLCEEALRISKKVFGSPDLLTLDNLALLYFDLGRVDEATPLVREEAAQQLNVFANMFSFTSEQQRLTYSTGVDPYSLFPMLKGTETDLATVVLRYKGVVLDSIVEDRLLAEANQGTEDRKLVEQLNLDKMQLGKLLLQPTQKFSDKTNQRIESLEAEVQKIESQLAQHVAGLGHARHALGMRIEQVQATIPNACALIEYLRYPHYLGRGKFEPRYGAIVLCSKGAPVWIPLGKAKDIEHLVRRYGTLVRDSTQEEELSANLQALYEALWAPISQALPSQTKRIIISPDGQLNFISFATLLTKDKQFLAQTYDVQYAASGRDLLREPKPSTAKEVVLFANPDFALASTPMLAKADNRFSDPGPKSIRGSEKRDVEDWSFESLTGTQKESNELTEKFVDWGWTPIDFTAKEATKEALLKIHSPYILHLATHGFFAKEDPTTAQTEPESSLNNRQSVTKSKFFKNPMHRSGLALAGAETTIEAWKREEVPAVENDGILTAEDVSTLDLQGTWLVTLSACDTGSGEARAGEGVMGLRRGFIQAGAQNLLMTLWPISDEVTVQIMSDFYDAAHKIGNAPEALAEVQRKWLLKLRTEKGLAQAVNLAGPFIMSSQGKP